MSVGRNIFLAPAKVEYGIESSIIEGIQGLANIEMKEIINSLGLL